MKKKKKSKRSMDSGWKTGGGLQMQTFDDVTTFEAEVLSDFEVSNGRSGSYRCPKTISLAQRAQSNLFPRASDDHLDNRTTTP